MWDDLSRLNHGRVLHGCRCILDTSLLQEVRNNERESLSLCKVMNMVLDACLISTRHFVQMRHFNFTDSKYVMREHFILTRRTSQQHFDLP